MTEKMPAPTQMMMSGAMATMGTVCSRIVYGKKSWRSQRHCAKTMAMPTPTTMLASEPAVRLLRW